MKEFITESVFFGVVITLVTYELGMWMKKKLKFAICNPLLIAIIAIILFLIGFDIDYEVYNEGAQFISYLLTPATVCLAVPLYEQFELLKKNVTAVLAGILAGVLTSATCVLVLCVLMKLGHEQYVTLLPKSITTAIGMVVSEELGGYATITVAVIVVTGIFGYIMADFILKIFRITDPIAKGVAIGTSSHAGGTARDMELGEVEGAMSSLSIAVAGLTTVLVTMIYANFY